MRYLLTALLLFPTLVFAEELHTFKNGEVADADKLNESLQYILNNASGGCSVEQVNNTAEITCADGTTAVVPGYGTVVVYPEGGITGEPPTNLPTGAVVVKDANDVILGELTSVLGATSGSPSYIMKTGDLISVTVGNKADDQSVIVTSDGRYRFYYTEPDCSGILIVPNDNRVVDIDGNLFVNVPGTSRQRYLIRSSRYSGFFNRDIYQTSGCQNGEDYENGYPGVEYTPAPEILNAAYPVRLEQLP